MELFAPIGSLGDVALLVGLATTRIAVTFVLLPVLAPDTVPAMVRNAMFLSLGCLTLALQPTVALGSFGAWQWLLLFGREAVLGLALGFGLAAFLWAFQAAGQIVDTKVAVGNGQLMDPMSGQQVSVTGALLGRLAGFLFMFGGGFMLFIGVLLESFRAWPLAQPGLAPQLQGLRLFEGYLHELMALAFLLAAPALVVMFAVDLSLGLVNRFAPQLNVIAVSMSLKALAATAIWLLLLGTLVQGFADELARRIAAVLPTLARLFPPI